jgi:hypothetical protein
LAGLQGGFFAGESLCARGLASGHTGALGLHGGQAVFSGSELHPRAPHIALGQGRSRSTSGCSGLGCTSRSRSGGHSRHGQRWAAACHTGHGGRDGRRNTRNDRRSGDSGDSGGHNGRRWQSLAPGHRRVVALARLVVHVQALELVL